MISVVVVDGSITPKWYFQEIHSAEAELLLTAAQLRLLAPAFLLVEFGSVLTKKIRRGELSLASGVLRSETLANAGLELADDADLLPEALELATQYHPSLYDCLYAALALREGCQVVTADRPFYDALRVPFPSAMLWIEDLPAALA